MASTMMKQNDDNHTTKMLQDSRKTVIEMTNIAENIQYNLSVQREQLNNIQIKVRKTDYIIDKARKTIANIKKNGKYNCVLFLVIIILITLIIVLMSKYIQ